MTRRLSSARTAARHRACLVAGDSFEVCQLAHAGKSAPPKCECRAQTASHARPAVSSRSPARRYRSLALGGQQIIGQACSRSLGRSGFSGCTPARPQLTSASASRSRRSSIRVPLLWIQRASYQRSVRPFRRRPPSSHQQPFERLVPRRRLGLQHAHHPRRQVRLWPVRWRLQRHSRCATDSPPSAHRRPACRPARDPHHSDRSSPASRSPAAIPACAALARRCGSHTCTRRRRLAFARTRSPASSACAACHFNSP